jgi:hypothetical protein
MMVSLVGKGRVWEKTVRSRYRDIYGGQIEADCERSLKKTVLKSFGGLGKTSSDLSIVTESQRN